jgi:hypothetical protein
MATRENQGLQATIIVLVILVIGLGVGLILVNNAKKTAQARAASAEERANSEQAAHLSAQEEANNYKEWMGFQPSDAKPAIEPLYQEDQERFMANIEEESRKYRTALDAIYEEREKLAASESKAKADVKEMQDRVLAIEAEKEAQVKEMEKALETAKKDAAAEKLKFQQFRDTMQAEKDQLAKDMAELRTTHDEAVAKLTAEGTELKTTIAKMGRSIDKLRAERPEVDQFAQPADGRITWVNQKYGKVWIDLGSADGLRPQVTFSVAAEGDADAEAAEKKGAIEVVRITAPHMAEARITSDESTNPLMPGDRIYSQVWDRGRQVGFAIAGFVDLDNDRRNDLQRLKNIITTNNCRIDAAPDEKGVNQGEITVGTRYLVLGEFPNGTTEMDKALLEGWRELGNEAERLGVETIAVDEFVKLMGWQQDNQSVVMGAGARAEDFPAEPRGQEMPRKTRQPEGVFKKRLPGVSY